jgi:hypothetical protein
VVVDDGPVPLDRAALPPGRAIAIRPPGRRSLGALRNLGLEAIPEAALWTYWDDDDWRHPHALTAQRRVLDITGVQTCLLTNQVKYSLVHDIAYVDRHPGGFAATLLGSKHPSIRFPDAAAGEDSAYLKELKASCPWYPWNNPPHLFLRLFHGANTWDATHFGLVGREAGSWRLPRRAAATLRQVLPLYRAAGAVVPDAGDPPAGASGPTDPVSG